MGIPEIFAYLESNEPELQREGAFMAGEAMCREAIPQLARLLVSPNLGVQDAADMSLRKLGGKEVVAAVIPLLRSEDAPARNLSMDILRQVGHHNVQPLIALLKDEDPDIRIFACDILGATRKLMAVHPLCDSLLYDPEVNVRYQAAVSLGEIGKSDATEALNEALKDDDWVKFAVIEALMKIRDDSSIVALLGALDKSSELVASIIIDALGEIGHIKAVPVLINYFTGAVPVLRNKILKAVVNIMGTKTLTFLSDKDRVTFASYLLSAVDDEDTAVQDAAIVGLSCIGGEAASDKILMLAASINQEQEPERFQKAINGLVALGLTPALQNSAGSDDEHLSNVALTVLIRMGTPDALQVCTKVFWHKDRDGQRDIARGVGALAGKEVKPFFLRILRESTDGSILKSALSFLGIRMQFVDVVEDIVPFLNHPFDDVKEVALDACIAIGGKSVEALFNKMLHDPDPFKRTMAVYAFGKMDVRSHLADLEDALNDEVADIRKIAMEAMAGVCGDNPDLLSRVVPRMINDESRAVRRSLVEFLGSSQCSDAVAYLIKALSDADDWVQIRAIESLGTTGRCDVIPALRPLLTSPNQLIRMKVVQALGRIGGKEAFQELLSILDTQDMELLEAAEQALDLIQADDDEVLG